MHEPQVLIPDAYPFQILDLVLVQVYPGTEAHKTLPNYPSPGSPTFHADVALYALRVVPTQGIHIRVNPCHIAPRIPMSVEIRRFFEILTDNRNVK